MFNYDHLHLQGIGSTKKLNELSVPIVSRTQCNERDWYNGDITEYMMCAGYEDGGMDSCSVGIW